MSNADAISRSDVIASLFGELDGGGQVGVFNYSCRNVYIGYLYTTQGITPQ